MIYVEVQVCKDRHGKSLNTSAHAFEALSYGISKIFAGGKAPVRAVKYGRRSRHSTEVPLRLRP